MVSTVIASFPVFVFYQFSIFSPTEKTLNLLYKGVSGKNLNNYVDKRQLFNQIQLLGDGNYKFASGQNKVK